MAITKTEKPISTAISRQATKPLKWKDIFGKLIVYLLLTVGAIIFIAPWAWMVVWCVWGTSKPVISSDVG